MARPWAWPHTTLWGSTRGRISTRQPWRPAVDEPSADTRARVWASSLRPLPRHARARQQLVRTSQVLTLGAHRYPCYSSCARGAPASPPMWGGFIRPRLWEGVGGLGGLSPGIRPVVGREVGHSSHYQVDRPHGGGRVPPLGHRRAVMCRRRVVSTGIVEAQARARGRAPCDRAGPDALAIRASRGARTPLAVRAPVVRGRCRRPQ